jgi:peptidoglycan/xylan/chitin deacetylase (PgdA/CDA1 family)
MHQTPRPPSNLPPQWPSEELGYRRALRNLGMRAAGRLGAWGAAIHRVPPDACVGILTYHRVIAPVRGLSPPLHNVAPGRFREQLAGLRRQGFTVRSLDELLELHRRGKGVTGPTVAITFDDGFANVHSQAWPILRELDMPATVFVNTAYLDQETPFPFDSWGVAVEGRAPRESYRPMTRAECREIAADGLIQLGGHTHTHEDYRGRCEALRVDLRRSIEVFRAEFGAPSLPFAFPFGSVSKGFCSPEMMSVVREQGFDCGLTMEAVPVDLADDPFGWGRFNVFAWDTSATLAAKLRGWYSWAPRLWQRVMSRPVASQGAP